MKIQLQKPVTSLQSTHKIEPVLQADFDNFCEQKIALQKKLTTALQTKETEEHLKNLFTHFLQQTHFQQTAYINTKSYQGQHGADLVIYPDTPSNSQVNVLIEIKRPDNQAEMITKENIATKAFYETVLYYLQEKITHQNQELKHILITNLVDFFLFDATEFNRLFTQHTTLIKYFKGWQSGQLDIRSTKEMYAIIEKIVQESNDTIQATHFTFTAKINDETALIHIFKLLSPKHLFKQNTLNDTNQLNTVFYNELLYIIGIEEVKQKSTRIIARCKKPKAASLLEITIAKLVAEDLLKNIPNLTQYGENEQEQLFHVALTLCLTWINRILFLKLLEAQLIRYHQSTQPYAFLDTKTVKDFNELNTLFFEVLALKPANRIACLQEQFHFIPYLNSSLFETTDLEKQTLRIANLRNHCLLPIFKQTVLKNSKSKKLTNKNLSTISYLFQFLNSYDFSQTVGDNILQKQQKDLINSAVLGLVFEKINGYQHGAVFTPSFITMYMCKVSLEKTVIQKFNSTYKWKVKTLQQLSNKIYNEDLELLEANKIFNTIKICDPAVGSGHFLVSALNELIRIKSTLKILCDETGRKIRDWNIDIINDALHIESKSGKAFEYLVKTKVNGAPYIDEEVQRVQQTLFQEKRYLMERCLFGVDINANSVQICRLRLWIELLKNAYYTPKSNFKDLETLPNIDINIKCGNSLISRFTLEEKLTKAFKNTKWNFNTYLTAVQAYKKETNSTNKQELRTLIKTIKTQFKTSISQQDKDLIQLKKLESELFLKENPSLFGFSTDAEKNASKREKARLQKEINTLQTTVADKKSGKLYQQAFEWRFEFPEVLNEKTIDFQGFDLVIGNPPYIDYRQIDKATLQAISQYAINYSSPRPSLYQYFIELGFHILKPKGSLCFINPNQFLSIDAGFGTRKFLLENATFQYIIDVSNIKIFESAATYTTIWGFQKIKKSNYNFAIHKCRTLEDLENPPFLTSKKEVLFSDKLMIIATPHQQLLTKIEKGKTKLSNLCTLRWGTSKSGYGKLKIKQETYKKLVQKEQEKYRPLLQTRDIKRYIIDWKEEYIPVDVYSNNMLTIFQIPKKIVIARMTLQLQAAIDMEQRFVGKSTVLFRLAKSVTFEYLLALLNAKVINFYYHTYFENTHMSGGYLRFDIPYLSQLPIPIISLEKQAIFAEKTQLLLANKNNKKIKEKLELEIDDLVYELYRLTNEEKQVIINYKKLS